MNCFVTSSIEPYFRKFVTHITSFLVISGGHTNAVGMFCEALRAKTWFLVMGYETLGQKIEL